MRSLFTIVVFICPVLMFCQPYNDWSDQESLMYSANSALMGDISELTAGISHNVRWTMFASSPTRSGLGLVLPFKEDKMTFGLEVFSDKIGPLSSNGAALHYAYKFGLARGRGDHLTLGGSIKAGQLLFDHDHLILADVGDDLFQNIESNTLAAPSASVGFNYTTAWPTPESPVQMQLAGSVARFLPFDDGFSAFTIDRKINWYGLMGLNILAGPSILLKPSLLLSDITGTGVNYALRIKGDYRKAGWLMVQFDKVGFFTLQAGAQVMKTHLGTFAISASNSWYFGQANTPFGSSRSFGLIYRRTIEKDIDN